jgi:hypothetical protein
MEPGAEIRWRVIVSGPTHTASSHTSSALRQNDRRAEWQVSWGFWGRPVDWPGAEKAEICSPKANSRRMHTFRVQRLPAHAAMRLHRRNDGVQQFLPQIRRIHELLPRVRRRLGPLRSSCLRAMAQYNPLRV